MSSKVTWRESSLLEPAMRALDNATAEARRLSTMVDRLERESLEITEALGLHDDTPHAEVMAHVRALVKEHAEMRTTIEQHKAFWRDLL